MGSRILQLAAIVISGAALGPSAEARGTACTSVGTVPVGPLPNNVVVNTLTNRIYTKSITTATVSVIDGATGALLTTIPVSAHHGTVGLNPTTNRVYATSLGPGVDVIDGATNTVITTIDIGGGAPWFPTANEVTNRIFVSISTGDRVAAIDGSTNTLIGTIVVGTTPAGTDVDPRNGAVYVANSGDGTVSVIDGAGLTVVRTIVVGGEPLGVVYDPVREKVYVSDRVAPLVTVIDANLIAATGTLTLPDAGFAMEHGGLDASSGALYLAASENGSASVIVFDVVLDAVRDTVPVASSLGTSAYDPATGCLYFAGQTTNDVEIVRCLPGLAFCDASDGALASCPCGNAGSADTGCDNAQGTGGVRAALTSQDTLGQQATLVGTGFPPASTPTAIVIRGNNQEATPQVFFDGVRCAGLVGFSRLAGTTASAGASVHAFGHGAGPGTFYYQIWYRNTPITFCNATAAANVSSGRSIVWP